MKQWRVPYPKFGDGPGLERVAKIALALGLDLADFGAGGAVIVGSNGKGSTAAMTSALLEQATGPVGLFTSPHLLDLNERFRIDGADIDDAELSHHWARVEAAAAETSEAPRLGGFEFLFLIAADWFAARGCRHTVWEAGIGGRLDPVRLIAAQRVALTSLDLEHTALLGNTLEEIARDKLDAAPKGARVFVSACCAPQRVAIEEHCRARDVTVTWVEPVAAAPLNGDHQRANAALASALAQDVSKLTPTEVSAGFAATRWAGRLERLSEDPLVVIDVGHTPAGVRAALTGFRVLAGSRRAVLVLGVSADKDVSAIVEALAPSFDTIICASAHHKGAPAAFIAAHANAVNPAAEIIVAESVAEARKLAIAKARDGAIYAAGGLFLAAEFKAVHVGRDPAGLGFF